jgi:hypothetical protein
MRNERGGARARAQGAGDPLIRCSVDAELERELVSKGVER